MTVPPITPPTGEPSRPYGVEPFPVSQYGEDYYGRRSYEPPPSKTMAVWALCLSFFGVASLVAVGLAISVLAKSRDGLDHGKGMAIAALVITPITITLTILGILVRLGVISGDVDEADRSPSGTVTEEQDISVYAVHVGDCLEGRGLEAMLSGGRGDVTDVRAVPCDEVHAVEVFHEFDVSGMDFPGHKEVRRQASRQCVAEFKPFVGVAYARSTLNVSFLGPQELSWLQGDRAVSCLVFEASGSTIGSLEGSKR